MTKNNLMYEKKNELDGDSPLIFTAVGVQLIELMLPSVEKNYNESIYCNLSYTSCTVTV